MDGNGMILDMSHRIKLWKTRDWHGLRTLGQPTFSNSCTHTHCRIETLLCRSSPFYLDKTLDFVGMPVWISQPQQAAPSSTRRVKFTQHNLTLCTPQKPIPRESAFIPLFLLLFCRGLKSPQKNPKKWLLWIFFFTFPGACASKTDLSCCTNHFGAPCTWWLRPWVPWGLKPEHPRISGWWF